MKLCLSLLCWELTKTRIYLEASWASWWRTDTHPSLTQLCNILYNLKSIKKGIGVYRTHRVEFNILYTNSKSLIQGGPFPPITEICCGKKYLLRIVFYSKYIFSLSRMKAHIEKVFQPNEIWLLFLPHLLLPSHNCLNPISLAGVPNIW